METYYSNVVRRWGLSLLNSTNISGTKKFRNFFLSSLAVRHLRDVYVAYRKAGYSKAFSEAHREEITLHKAAKQAFSELGVEKLPTVKQLNEEYAELLAGKKEAYREYRKAKQEMTDFATAKYDIERFLNLEKEEETKAREKAKRKEETL